MPVGNYHSNDNISAELQNQSGEGEDHIIGQHSTACATLRKDLWPAKWTTVLCQVVNSAGNSCVNLFHVNNQTRLLYTDGYAAANLLNKWLGAAGLTWLPKGFD